MLHVLHLFLDPTHRSVRFGEAQERLALSPKTLSRRLRTLVEAGLLVRRQYNEIPPRVEYEATEKGQRLVGLFQAMESWASQNSLHTVRTVSVVGPA
jgi:DNA-binding HxlR family transcriptional regulator